MSSPRPTPRGPGELVKWDLAAFAAIFQAMGHWSMNRLKHRSRCKSTLYALSATAFLSVGAVALQANPAAAADQPSVTLVNFVGGCTGVDAVSVASGNSGAQVIVTTICTGDNLTQLIRKTGSQMTIKTASAYNGLGDPNRIVAGKTLTLIKCPDGTTMAQSGDTATAIATRSNLSVQEFVKLNSLGNANSITAGGCYKASSPAPATPVADSPPAPAAAPAPPVTNPAPQAVVAAPSPTAAPTTTAAPAPTTTAPAAAPSTTAAPAPVPSTTPPPAPPVAEVLKPQAVVAAPAVQSAVVMVQSLASQVLNNPNITIADSPGDRVRASFGQGAESGAACLRDVRLDCDQVELNPALFTGLLELAKTQPVTVWSLTTGDHADASEHYKGNAVDISVDDMTGAFLFLYDHRESFGVNELIFAGDTGGLRNLKNGKPFNYSAAVQAAHKTHIHVDFFRSTPPAPAVVAGTIKTAYHGADPAKAQQGYARLIERGLTPRGAAYLIASFIQESTLNESAVNGPEQAYGLAQWRGGRRDNAPAGYLEQIDYAFDEMQNAARFPGAFSALTNPNATDAQLRQAIKVYEGYGDEGDRTKIAKAIIAETGN